ncbi:MAG TPA: hypothetical protein VFZ20_02410 [Longimicrobium sp.]|nr:hypothetical protein [Longimicrobium sp.]
MKRGFNIQGAIAVGVRTRSPYFGSGNQLMALTARFAALRLNDIRGERTAA